MSNSSMYGLGAQRHAVSIAESYRRQASGGRGTLLEQQASVKKPKNGDSSPLVLHKHQHDDTHTHYHGADAEHGEPDADNELEVVRRPERTVEGRRRTR